MRLVSHARPSHQEGEGLVSCNRTLVPDVRFSKSQSDFTAPHFTAKQWTLRKNLGALSGCAAKLSLSSLKQKQKEAVMQSLNKKHVFVVLPTGFGKSICYGILPIVFDLLLNPFVKAERYTIN